MVKILSLFPEQPPSYHLQVGNEVFFLNYQAAQLLVLLFKRFEADSQLTFCAFSSFVSDVIFDVQLFKCHSEFNVFLYMTQLVILISC